MDPLSIASTSFGLAKTCVKIYQYVSSIQNVDVDIRVLCVEIDQLSMVLDSISSSFTNSSGAGSDSFKSLTGHEAQYWQNVKRSLDDCQETLGILEGILGKTTTRGFWERAKKRIQLDTHSGEITLLKQQISAYRRAMQLSLQLIAMHTPP